MLLAEPRCLVPTVNWVDEASHAYCFDGITPGQIVSIGVPDTRRPHVIERYRTGVEAMYERLQPRMVIVYGRLPVMIAQPPANRSRPRPRRCCRAQGRASRYPPGLDACISLLSVARPRLTPAAAAVPIAAIADVP